MSLTLGFPKPFLCFLINVLEEGSASPSLFLQVPCHFSGPEALPSKAWWIPTSSSAHRRLGLWLLAPREAEALGQAGVMAHHGNIAVSVKACVSSYRALTKQYQGGKVHRPHLSGKPQGQGHV